MNCGLGIGERRGEGRELRSRPAQAAFGRGFSLVELVAVLAVAVILALIVGGAFSKATGREALDKETLIVLSLLERARNLTLSAKNASAYGVHFESAKAVLFTGPSYSAGELSNVSELMNPMVQISAVSLSGGGSEVLFNRLAGDTSQSGTVKISLVADATQFKTITVSATGLSGAN